LPKIIGGASNVRLAKITEVADPLYLLDFKNLTDLNSLTFDASPNHFTFPSSIIFRITFYQIFQQ
jgi:hypothetical protein